MILLRSLMSFSLAVALFLPTSTAEAAKAKKAKPSRGEVTAIQTSENDKDTGTLTLKIAAKKKKKGDAATEEAKPEEKTFTISKDTKFVKVTGKKADRKEEALTFADIKAGSRVLVLADKDGKAEKVMVAEGKKAKKKKNNQ